MEKVRNFFSIAKLVCKKKCQCKKRGGKKGGASKKQRKPKSEIEYFFQKACQFIKKIPNVPSELQLELYGLFKQQKEGDFKEIDESQCDYIEKQKYAAWKKFQGLSKEDVYQSYVELVLQFDPEFQIFVKDYIDQGLDYEDEYEEDLDNLSGSDSQEEKKGGTTFGLAPSKMVVEEDYNNEKLEQLEDLTQEQQQLFDIIGDGNVEYVKNLDSKKIDFSMKNEQGITVLHFAVDSGETEIAKLLIEKCNQQNVGVNIQDIEGQTALHYAVLVEDEEIIQLLLENGADANIEDNNKETPYNLATQNIKQLIDDYKKSK